MKIDNFKIGRKFWMSGKQYVCADIGTHSIVAVPYDIGQNIELLITSYDKKGVRTQKTIFRKRTLKEFKSLFPEGLENIVISRYDIPACEKSKTPFQKSLEKMWKKKINA